MKKVRISSKYPFDFEGIIGTGKYMYVPKGKDKNPHIVLYDECKERRGVVISTYSDGICIDGYFSDTSSIETVDVETLTKDINEGVVNWLVSIGGEEFLK